MVKLKGTRSVAADTMSLGPMWIFFRIKYHKHGMDFLDDVEHCVLRPIVDRQIDRERICAEARCQNDVYE